MKPVANLVIEMAANVARLEKDMQSARRSVDGAMQKIQRSAQMAMRALGALGLGLGVAQLNSFVKQAINAGDRMQKLSQQIGVATENIAGLEMAFRQGGAGAGEMEVAMARLSVGVNKQSDVYKKLGIQSKDTLGALMEVADVVQQMPDGLQKSAIANELFGRSGAKLIPILNQGSEGLRRYIELTQKLGTAVTPEVAKQFELYNDTLDDVQEAMRGLAMQAAVALIPTLQSIAEALRNAFADGSVQRGIQYLIEAIKLLGIAIAGKLIAAIAGMTAGMIGLAASMTAGTAAVGGLSVALAGMKGVLALMGGPVGLIATAAGALVYFTEKAHRAETTADGLAESLGLTNAELRNMTQIQIEQKIIDIAIELQKLELQAIKTAAAQALLNEQLSDPEAYAFSGGQLSTELGTINKKIGSFQELMERLKDRLVEGSKASNTAAKSIANIAGSASNAEDKVRKLIRAYTDETATMTMSNREKEYFLFLNQMEAEGIKGNTELWYQLAAAYREAQEQRTSTEAVIAAREADKKRLEERIKSEEEFAKQAEQINNQIGQSLTDALVEGGVSAKDFLIKMFRTLVLRPIIQPIISGVLGAFGVGSAGAALAGVPGAGGGTDVMGLVGALKSGYDVLSGGFASIGSAASNFTASLVSSSLAVDGITGSLAANAALIESGTVGLSGAAMEGAALTVSQSAVTVGAAATVLAGVAAGVAAGSFISGQYSVLGNNPMVATGLGTAAGLGIAAMAGLGPVGLAIGALLGGAGGGLLNRAFGQSPKQTQDAGITGTISAGGTSLSQFTDWRRKGGWFSRGSSGRSMGGADQGFADYFNNTLSLVSGSVAVMAQSIGESTNAIAGYSEQITISLLNLTEVQAQEKLQEAVNNFTNNLIVKALPTLKRYQRESETATQTLSRLSQSLTIANQIFKTMDMTTLDLTIQAADSASNLIDLTGGIEQFTSKMDFFYQKFFDNQERLDKAIANLNETFASLGFVLPQTREQFKELVQVVQQAGSNTLLAALLEIAPAFDAVATATDQLAMDAAQTASKILQERTQFEIKIAQALGDTAFLRKKELESIQESNRALAISLYELADAQSALSASSNQTDKAFADLERALQTRLTTTLANLKTEFESLTKSLDEQIKAVSEAERLAQSNISSLNSIFTYLQDQINDLQGVGKQSYTFAQAIAFLAEAEQNLALGKGLPEQSQIASVVASARAAVADSSQFVSSFEQQRATALLVSQLTKLKDATSNQISIEEAHLRVAQEQLRSLYASYDQATLQYALDQDAAQQEFERQLNIAQNQINVLRNIDDSVFGVEQAIYVLGERINEERNQMLFVQQQMIALQQEQNAREQAELDRQAAERRAAEERAAAEARALQEAQRRAQERAAAEAAAAEAARQAAARAQAEAAARAAAEAARRAEEERQRNAELLSALWGGGSFWDAFSGNQPSSSWGGSDVMAGHGGYADGGLAPPGVALVGEEGPELVNFARPGMVYTAGETAEILNGGGGNTQVASEIRALREENQAQSRAMVALQSRMNRLLERWDGDGLPEERVVTA